LHNVTSWNRDGDIYLENTTIKLKSFFEGRMRGIMKAMAGVEG